VTGVGGTGVVNNRAADWGWPVYIEGKGVFGMLDMAGMAQKGGALWSHYPQLLPSNRNCHCAPYCREAQTSLLLGCDLVGPAPITGKLWEKLTFKE